MSLNHGANLYDLSKKYGFSKEEFLDFSSNINPLGASKAAKDVVIKNIDQVSIYPDPDYINLKSSISSYCHCNKENIVLGSGATELISSFIKTINPTKALLLSPAYSEYEKELKKINCNIDKYYSKHENKFKINVNDLVNHINNNKYDLIIICNPNNPTGFTFSKAEIKTLLESTNTFFMIDETYIEFTDTKAFSSTSLVDDYNNIFVIRGTSKFFSTPGIRLGYGLISNTSVKDSISSHLDLWNINIFATLMGEVMFKDTYFIENTINVMTKERDYLFDNLRNIDDLNVYDSQGNFILCEIKSKKLTASKLRDKLIPKKIIIRDCASFDGLNKYFFRVCILKPEDNRLLINSLNDIF